MLRGIKKLFTKWKTKTNIIYGYWKYRAILKSFPNILRQVISSSIKLLSKYHIRSIFLSDWTMNFSFEFDIDKCRNLMVILETACKLQTLCRTYSPVASPHGWMFINLFRDVMSLICKKMDMNFHAYTEIIFLVFLGKLVLP